MANEPESLEAPQAPESTKSVPSESLDSAVTAPQPEVGDNSQKASQPPPDKFKPWKHLKNMGSLYLMLFILLVVGAIGVILVTAKSNKNSTKTTNATSLTDKQLAAISGNTTLIGDSKQTLDVQGSTIFEGQVLMRNDLNVAGTLKVGVALSLPTITVSGQGTFGQLATGGTLAVGGNATISGILSAQKNLSVAGGGSFGGNLSAPQLTVTTLQLTGDFQVSRHIAPNGATPARSNGSALGSGGTASVSGTDTAGTITINTGSSPSTGSLITVNFVAKFNNTPHVVVTPVGSAAAGLQYYVTRTNTSFTLSTANAPSAGISFSFDYIVID